MSQGWGRPGRETGHILDDIPTSEYTVCTNPLGIGLKNIETFPSPYVLICVQ